MNLAGKTYRAVKNSANGALNTDTAMTFLSDDSVGIRAVYRGGTIASGELIAKWREDTTLDMLYHCVTTAGDLRAGRAMATFRGAAEGRSSMHLDWEWLTGDRTRGNSDWVESAD